MPSRENKLEIALNELVRFAVRNEKRALQAFKDAKTLADEIDDDYDVIYDKIRAEARHHEAQRVLLVVRDRVKEALS